MTTFFRSKLEVKQSDIMINLMTNIENVNIFPAAFPQNNEYKYSYMVNI